MRTAFQACFKTSAGWGAGAWGWQRDSFDFLSTPAWFCETLGLGPGSSPLQTFLLQLLLHPGLLFTKPGDKRWAYEDQGLGGTSAFPTRAPS